jgi:RHS repeat-associated protein
MLPVLKRDAVGNTLDVAIRAPDADGGIGGLLYSYAGTKTWYYHADLLGDVRLITDGVGAVIQRYDYDAFGNIISQSGSAGNDYQYKTKESSSVSGSIYFGARYYDPLLGRFLTTDPLGMVDGTNMYLYCGNDPVNKRDLWGLCWAKFKKYDITSWILLGTNYGGITKSGPGGPTSALDRVFKKHDEDLRATGTFYWDLSNAGVRKAHKDLIIGWMLVYLSGDY